MSTQVYTDWDSARSIASTLPPDKLQIAIDTVLHNKECTFEDAGNDIAELLGYIAELRTANQVMLEALEKAEDALLNWYQKPIDLTAVLAKTAAAIRKAKEATGA